MNKNFKRIALTVIAAALLLTAFAGCDLGMPWDTSIWGSWDDGYGGRKTFTNTTFTVDGAPVGTGGWDYSGDITKYINGSYNIPSENPTEGQYGYMVLKITAHESDSSQVGDFTVLRWRALTTAAGTTTVEHSEGYPHFATAEEAEAKAVEEANFQFYSSMTKVAE